MTCEKRERKLNGRKRRAVLYFGGDKLKITRDSLGFFDKLVRKPYVLAFERPHQENERKQMHKTANTVATRAAWPGNRDFETLVLPSGGARGCALLGALSVMEKVYGSPLFRPDSKLRNVVGCSVGAIIGMFLACGCTVEDLRKLVANSVVWNDLLKADPLRMLLDGNLGMNDGSKVLDFLKLQLRNRVGDHELTLEELRKRTGVTLICVRCRVKSATIDFVGPWPGGQSEKVYDAVFDSMRVPPVFDPAFRDDELLSDGALICSFPFAYLELIGLDPTKSLGLCFDEPKTKAETNPNATKSRGEEVRRFHPLGHRLDSQQSRSHDQQTASDFVPLRDLELIDWVHMLASTAARVLERFQRAAVPDWLWEWNVMCIRIENSMSMELKASPQRVHQLFTLGEKSAREFFMKRLLATGLLETAMGSLGNPLDDTEQDFPPPKIKQE